MGGVLVQPEDEMHAVIAAPRLYPAGVQMQRIPVDMPEPQVRVRTPQRIGQSRGAVQGRVADMYPGHGQGIAVSFDADGLPVFLLKKIRAQRELSVHILPGQSAQRSETCAVKMAMTLKYVAVRVQSACNRQFVLGQAQCGVTQKNGGAVHENARREFRRFALR